MRWCLNRGDFAFLQKHHAKNLHMLIVVAYENGKEDRYLVPLEEVMTFITFRYPGNHTIFAKVVWHDDFRALSHQLLNGPRKGIYDQELLNRDRTALHRFSRMGLFGYMLDELLDGSPEDDQTITVAREYFAKEPPRWIWRWANFWFDFPPYDQCAFRRRVILAFTLQPALVALYLTARFICQVAMTLILAAGGMRGLHPKNLFHPWSTSFWDFYQKREYEADILKRFLWNRHSSWFLEKADGSSRHSLTTLGLCALHPICLLLYWITLEHYSRLYHMTYAQLLWAALAGLAGLALTLIVKIFTSVWMTIAALIICLFVGLSIFGSRILNYLQIRSQKIYLQQQEAAAKPDFQAMLARQEMEHFNTLYRVMACTRAPKEVSLDTLPAEKRTIKLRYFDLKAHLCKPFAR